MAGKLRAAGYRVTLDEFDFPIWTKNARSTFAKVTPAPAATYVEDTDYIVARFSSSSNLMGATVVPTNDIDLTPDGGPGTGTSGCEPTDFPATTAGNVALMQRWRARRSARRSSTAAP